MKLMFTEKAWGDYLFWQKQDKQMVKKINNLVKDIKREPFEELGKPEPLKYELSGFWSRRITDEHRLVCKVDDATIMIVACKYHY